MRTVWAALAVALAPTLCGGFMCPGRCDVTTDLSFCRDTSYTSCQLDGNSWKPQDDAARESMELILQQYGHAINRSQACYQAVKAFQCASEFSVCEGVDGDAQPVCRSSCQTVRDSCELTEEEKVREGDIIEDLYELDDDAYLRICGSGTKGDDDAGLVSPLAMQEENCFELNYTGPSYYLWAIGLGLAVSFSFFSAVALNIQKLSLMRHGEGYPVYKQPLWILGFFLLLLGSIMDFVALGLAPASLLAPLAALSLVWNMVAAPCFLKEKLTPHQITATLIIFSGAVLAVCFSSHASPSYTLEDLKLLFLRYPMKLYTAIVPSIVIMCMVTIEVIESLSPERRAMSSLRSLHMLCYAGAAGITGGQSILYAKATAELFKSAFRGAPGLGRTGETYLIVTGMIFCMLIQITYLNGGLLHHNSLTVVPVYQAFWIISGIIGGLVYFDEIRSFTELQLGIFSLGVLVTISGVGYLAFLAHAHHKHEPVRPGFVQGDHDDDEYGEDDDYFYGDDGHVDTFYPEDNAFNAYVQSTPRAGAAEVLLDFGVAPNQVRRMIGSSSRRLLQEQKKELVLTDMGVRPDIRQKMIQSFNSDKADSMRQLGSIRQLFQQQKQRNDEGSQDADAKDGQGGEEEEQTSLTL